MTKPTLLFALCVLSCSGSPAPGAQAPPPNPPSEPRVANAGAPSTSPSAPATSAPTPASPFEIIGELPGEVRLFGAGERGFVVAPSLIAFSLVGDDVVHDPLLQRGFSDDPMFMIEGVTGRWPDGAWLATTHPSGRSGFTKLWNWDGKRWVTRQSTPETRFIAGIRPWIGGRQLAVEQHGMMFDAAFRIVSGDKNVTLPVFTKRPSPQGFCNTELQVQAFETLPNGEIIAAGCRCNDEEVTSIGVERWTAGSKKGVLESLPGTNIAGVLSTNVSPSLVVTGLAARSGSDVILSGERETWYSDTKRRDTSTYLARFDGSRWLETRSNVPGLVKSLASTSEGALFVTNDRGELYTGRELDALSLMPLPAKLFEPELAPFVTSVWFRAPGDVWVVAQMIALNATGPERFTPRRYLLHTRPATGKLPSLEEFEEKERAYRLPGPPVEWCTTPFVLLYTLGKKAPKDYDYPSTRAALRGHREFSVKGVEFIEFERTGSRFFGARVPDFTLGKKLATLVKEKVAGSTPELVCHDPPPARTLTIDFSPAKN